MSIDQDREFLASLRGMVDNAAPQIAQPSAATVIPAARRRVAHRRSLISGAFGVVLLAGAGVSQVLPGNITTPTPIVQLADGDVAPEGYTRGAPEPVGIAPFGEPFGSDIGDEYPAVESAEDVTFVEAAPGAHDPAHPWTIGLLSAGAAALGTGAVIAAHSRRAYAAATAQAAR